MRSTLAEKVTPQIIAAVSNQSNAAE